MGRRKFFEKFAVIGNFRELLRFDAIERVGQRHFAVAVMMAVRFAIGRNVHHLRPSAGARKGPGEALGELFAVMQELFKGDSLRNRAIVKKQRQAFCRWDP